MSNSTAVEVPRPAELPLRFEIRKLTEDHLEWAKALINHSNVFDSPVWSVCYPEELTKRLFTTLPTTDYLVRHQIESGYSYGIFDTEYVFKRPESAATNGKLYWDPTDLSADRNTLLEQMDFPLVSVALAYDAINPLDGSKLVAWVQSLPLLAEIGPGLVDMGAPEPWKAKGPREVLMRNATATKCDYMGQGLMKILARYLMRLAAADGFRAISIVCVHDAVTKTWLYPPSPFKGELVAQLDPKKYTKADAEGKEYHPFHPSTQVISKVYVSLK